MLQLLLPEALLFPGGLSSSQQQVYSAASPFFLLLRDLDISCLPLGRRNPTVLTRVTLLFPSMAVRSCRDSSTSRHRLLFLSRVLWVELEVATNLRHHYHALDCRQRW